MNIELGHRFTPDVDVLNLLGRDVLALRQLKDVLLPVNDLQRTILQTQGKERKEEGHRKTTKRKDVSVNQIARFSFDLIIIINCLDFDQATYR